MIFTVIFWTIASAFFTSSSDIGTNGKSFLFFFLRTMVSKTDDAGAAAGEGIFSFLFLFWDSDCMPSFTLFIMDAEEEEEEVISIFSCRERKD